MRIKKKRLTVALQPCTPWCCGYRQDLTGEPPVVAVVLAGVR